MNDNWQPDQKGIFLDDDYVLNSCETNDWNCDDFCTQQDAQKVFEECARPSSPDVHNLDSDGNGIACERLPDSKNNTSVDVK